MGRILLSPETLKAHSNFPKPSPQLSFNGSNLFNSHTLLSLTLNLILSYQIVRLFFVFQTLLFYFFKSQFSP